MKPRERSPSLPSALIISALASLAWAGAGFAQALDDQAPAAPRTFEEYDDDLGEEPSDPRAVDLELVLAVDISRSMDYQEQLIQRDGYVAAFRDESVISALTGGYNGRAAVTYMEWANEYTQIQTVPWTIIESVDDALAFAAAMDAAEISAYRGTSISGALQAAANLINGNEYDGIRRVIDISGDGSNRDGPPLEPIRRAVGASGIIVNGLPLMLRGADGGGFGGGGFGYNEVGDLAAYYESQVIVGTGSFMLPVRSVEELPASIRQKLILEIVGTPTLGPRAELETESDTALE